MVYTIPFVDGLHDFKAAVVGLNCAILFLSVPPELLKLPPAYTLLSSAYIALTSLEDGAPFNESCVFQLSRLRLLKRNAAAPDLTFPFTLSKAPPAYKRLLFMERA